MKRALLMSLLIIFVLSGFAGASKEVSVNGIRHWSSESYTRVVIDLGGPVVYSHNRLSNPDRLYFDLVNSRLSKQIAPSVPIEDGILKDVRSGQFNDNTVRIVLDLQEIENFNTFILEDPYRLVIDISGRENTGLVPYKKLDKEIVEIKRVIIDPGHGGKDPGAIGPRGLKEKDVVLKIAKRLGKILKKKYNIEVIYTRDRDVFIPLEKRTFIANSKKADLFLSIHANASRQRKARGIETYILNWTTDKEAMRVAARENKISMNRMQKSSGSIQTILQDLARDKKKDESMKLAHNVQGSMVNALKKDYNKVIDLGVKQALFYVLVGAEMPSVLIEVAFISNYEEEKRLSGNSYSYKIAEAIAKGVDNYSAPLKLAQNR